MKRTFKFGLIHYFSIFVSLLIADGICAQSNDDQLIVLKNQIRAGWATFQYDVFTRTSSVRNMNQTGIKDHQILAWGRLCLGVGSHKSQFDMTMNAVKKVNELLSQKLKKVEELEANWKGIIKACELVEQNADFEAALRPSVGPDIEAVTDLAFQINEFLADALSQI